jgi:hypothetical protein
VIVPICSAIQAMTAARAGASLAPGAARRLHLRRRETVEMLDFCDR